MKEIDYTEYVITNLKLVKRHKSNKVSVYYLNFRKGHTVLQEQKAEETMKQRGKQIRDILLQENFKTARKGTDTDTRV